MTYYEGLSCRVCKKVCKNGKLCYTTTKVKGTNRTKRMICGYCGAFSPEFPVVLEGSIVASYRKWENTDLKNRRTLWKTS